MKKILSLFFIILFSIFNACTNSFAASSTLRVGLNPWIGTGLFYIAKDKGFFAAEKINVDLVKYDEGGVGKELLSSGRIDLLATTPETVIVLTNAGVKVNVIGILDTSHGADGIIATNNIASINDLKGKDVAFEVGSSSHLLLSYFLNQHGLTTKDLTTHNLPASDAGAAFVAGRVDAAVTWEPWLSKAGERKGGHVLIDSRALELFPDFYIVRAEVVKENAAALRSMLRGLFSAEKFLNEHQDEAVKIIAKNLSISEDEARAEIKTLKWLDYNKNVTYFLAKKPSQAVQVLQQAGDLWLKLGLISKKINANDIIDSDLLKNLYTQ